MASWRSLRSAVFSSVMSRAKSETARGRRRRALDRAGGLVSHDPSRHGKGPALAGAEGELPLPAALGEDLALDEVAVERQARRVEHVLEPGRTIEHPDAEHLAGRLVAVAEMTVGTGGDEEVRALLEHGGQPGRERRWGIDRPEVEDLEDHAVDPTVGTEGGRHVGPDGPARPGQRGRRRAQQALEGVAPPGGDLLEMGGHHLPLRLLDQLAEGPAAQRPGRTPEEVDQHGIGMAEPALGPEDGHADGHRVEHLGGGGQRQGRGAEARGHVGAPRCSRPSSLMCPPARRAGPPPRPAVGLRTVASA